MPPLQLEISNTLSLDTSVSKFTLDTSTKTITNVMIDSEDPELSTALNISRT